MQRRDFLRVGGLGLCGIGALDLIQAQAATGAIGGKAKQMIVCWLGGGPPHLDMFDMKPDASEDYRGIFKPIATTVPGLQVGELIGGVQAGLIGIGQCNVIALGQLEDQVRFQRAFDMKV